MNPSQYQSTPGGWEWPDFVQPAQSTKSEPTENQPVDSSSEGAAPTATPSGQRPRRTHWPPRTCRICLETVQPTFREQNENLPRMFHSAPDVTYESEEGRLIRPCKCKGSQRYVHEGCLQAWRHSDPSYGRRHYWQCPTCGFRYRLDRMSWGRIISSTSAQLVLTAFTLVLVVFLLGFVGDFILDLYFDPWGTMTGYRPEVVYRDDEPPTWTEHFLKGGASLGLMSCAKLLLSTRSFYRFGGGGRPARNGRDRLADVSMLMVIIGVVAFLWSVWKGTRALTRRYLTKVAERVLDVQGDDNGDDDDE